MITADSILKKYGIKTEPVSKVREPVPEDRNAKIRRLYYEAEAAEAEVEATKGIGQRMAEQFGVVEPIEIKTPKIGVKEVAREIPGAIGEMAKQFFIKTPLKIATSLAPEKVRQPFREKIAEPILGKIGMEDRKIRTYAEDVEALINEGTNPILATVAIGSEGMLDAIIVGSFVKAGARLAVESIKPSHVTAARSYMGLPKIFSQIEREKAYKGLSKILHPDKPTGSEEAFKRLNEANQILKGAHPEVIQMAGRFAEELLKPLSKVGIGAEVPYGGKISGLLPAEAGTIPEYRAPQLRFGMAIEERPARKVGYTEYEKGLKSIKKGAVGIYKSETGEIVGPDTWYPERDFGKKVQEIFKGKAKEYGLDKKGVSDEAMAWLVSGRGPTKKVVNELSVFNPKRPIKVYEVISDEEEMPSIMTEYIGDRKLAESFVEIAKYEEKKRVRIITKMLSPDQIIFYPPNTPTKMEGYGLEGMILAFTEPKYKNLYVSEPKIVPEKGFQGYPDLTTKFLEYAKGKTTLSKQEIMDFARRPELKKGEADLLLRKLEEFIKEPVEKISQAPTKGGSVYLTEKDIEIIKKRGDFLYREMTGKISAQEFADSIRRDLLELKPVKVKEPQYGATTLDRDIHRVLPDTIGKNYEEVVFESPIQTGAGFGKGAGASSHYPNSQYYFAHARGDEVVESGKKVWREQEIQSDLLQKDKLETAVKTSGYDVEGTPKQKIQAVQKSISQLDPFTNDRFGERIMRERIKEKASKGYDKYRLPTGETIGKIEGFETSDFWKVDSNGVFKKIENNKDLSIGDSVGRGSRTELENGELDEIVVTDILGDGRFKAVPKSYGKFRIVEENGRFIVQKYEEQVGKKPYNMVYYTDRAGAENRIKTDLERAKETFDLTGKSNPQYRRYEQWGKFLKNKYGGKEVTDPQGNSWMEIDLKKEYGEAPVEAFKRGKMRGEISIEEAKKIIFEEIPENEVRLIFEKDSLNKAYGGFYRGVRPELKNTLKPIINLVENKGKVSAFTAYHESFEYTFRNFLTETEQEETLQFAKERIGKGSEILMKMGGYEKDVFLTEYLANTYADYWTRKNFYKTDRLFSFFRKLDDIIRRIKEIYGKVKSNVERFFAERGGAKGGFVKIPKRKTVFGKKPEEIMEAEFQKETGEIAKTAKDTLFKDIKKLGGIRPYEGKYLAEEFSAIPIELVRKSAPNNLDQMAIELNEMGYRYSSGEELREGITQIKTGKIKVTKPDIEAFQKVTRMKVESPEQAKEALENYIRKIIRVQKYALKRVFKETEIKAKERGFIRGRRIGEKTLQEKIQERRVRVKAVSSYLGLTDADIRKINKKDIRFMDDEEFKKFMEDFEIKAIQQAETRQAKSELIDLINQKDFRKTENYRKVLKLPPYSEMNAEQFRQFAEALEPFQKGDEFLSPRRLEVVDRTDLEGIRTWREARERLAKEAGVPAEELDKIKVRELDDYLWDTALAERNPLYRIMVDTVNRELLQAEARSLQVERQIFNLAEKSNKSRKQRGLIGKLIPQDEQIMNYLEAPADKKAGLAMQMTAEQLDYAGYIQEKFKEALEYLIQEKALARGRENYFTHIRRTLLEDIKEDGLIKAFKNVFEHYKEDEMVFNILDQDTGNILPLEKFFAYALRRGGRLAPTKNITRAFLVYWRTLEKKRALDAIVPKLDIYAQSLTPIRYTPRGLEMDRSIKQFVNKWVNTKKGRKIRWIAKQGGKLDMAIRLGRTITSIIDLGYNIFANVAATVGENMMTYQQLGARQYVLGKIRMQTKQGKTILQKYENFTGRSAWDEITEPDKPIEERLMESLFYLFRRSSVKSNQTFLLGSLTDAEWRIGEVTLDRLAELRRTMGRYRDIKGAQSIVGATTAGGAATQYKRWAIPIIRTILVDIKNLAQGFAKKKLGTTIKSNEAKEFLRTVELVTFILVLGAYVKSNEKDDTFVGKLEHRVYVESLTILGAFESVLTAPIPRLLTFLDTLGKNLRTLILLEEYKTRGGLKGVEALKRQFMPSILKQVIPKKEEAGGKLPIKPEDILRKYMAPSKVDPEAILRKYGI